MRSKLIIFALIVSTFSNLLYAQEKGENQNQQDKWIEIDSLMNLGLIKTAQPKINEIYEQSISSDNLSDYFKSLIYTIDILRQNDDFDINALKKRLQMELESATILQQAVLHSVLAEAYVGYYSRNWWNLQNISSLDPEASEDIKTWSEVKFQKEILRELMLSVAHSDTLLKTKINKLEGVLTGDSTLRYLQPTLYDLLANRFIYLSNKNSYLEKDEAKPKDVSLFLPAEDFIKLEVDSSKFSKSDYQIISLFQQLLSYHKSNQNIDALISIDLRRLKFVRNQFLAGEKHELSYINALNAILTVYPHHSLSAEVEYEKARVYAERGGRYNAFDKKEYRWELKKAAEICKRVIEEIPQTLGATYCEEMLKGLQSSYTDINLKSVQVSQTPVLASLEYKNCSKLYFRIVRLNYKKEAELRDYQRVQKRLKHYIQMEAEEEWFQDMPDEGDLQSHNLQFVIPDLNYGYYVLLTSKSPNFHEEDLLHTNFFWVSDLSMISREDNRQTTDIFVMNRKSGIPIKGVKVDISKQEWDYKTQKNISELEVSFYTDKFGYVNFKADLKHVNRQIMLSHGADTLVEDFRVYRHGRYNSDPKTEVRLFTDRKIYRPGQTIYFKGIVVNRKENDVNIVPNRKVNLEFWDVNNQIIKNRNFTSNEFGSFQGAFIIPENTLSGQMMLRTPMGLTEFSVEEYKRPNFEVVFDDVESQLKLNDTITITGLAKSFSGTTLNNVNIRYTVKRSDQEFYYSGFDYYGEEKQLLSGELKTDDEGKFEVKFLDLVEDENSVYRYRLEVEATDLNGETQSGTKSIVLSHTNLILKSAIGDKICKEDFKEIPVEAINFYGYKQEVNVSASIYKVTSPEKAFKNRTWARPDQFLMDKETFYTYFPHNQYDDETDVAKWPVENQIFQAEINTGERSGFVINDIQNWDAGMYKLVLKTHDQFGEEVEETQFFRLFSANAKKLAVPEFDWFYLNSNKARPGDTCYFVIGSQARNTSVLYELQQNSKLLHSDRFRLNREQKRIEIPITRENIGELVINIVYIKNNELYERTETIRVDDPQKELKVKLQTFRSVLQPGEKESWILKVEAHPKKSPMAEVLCTMTDASLETFRPNHWRLDFHQYYTNTINWKTYYGFDYSYSRMLNRKYYSSYFSDIDWNLERFIWDISNLDYVKRSLIVSNRRSDIYPPPPPDIRIRGASMMNNQAPPDFKESEVMMAMEDADIDAFGDGPNMQDTQLKIRKNFSETAFFYPQLKTDSKGNVSIKFTSPEALTRWKFMALAHTKDLRVATFTQEVVTQKQLMVSPNLPRFFRHGDTIYFSAKVSNLSEEAMQTKLNLKFFNAEDLKPIENFILDQATKEFSIDAKSNAVKSWKLFISEEVNAVMYRLIAESDKFSDGEERIIPVLSNRMLVTESLPIHLNAYESKKLKLKKLIKSDSTSSLKHHRLTFEMATNPNWYAIQALPYIDKSCRKNAIALYNRYYANKMASFILNSNPKIKRVIQQWKNQSPDAFLSQLEKNQNLKAVLIEETPWLMEAISDGERKRRLALFFDLNTMNQQLESTLEELLELQLYDGSWIWYKGDRGNRYITQNIVGGLLRMKDRGILKSSKGVDDAIKLAISYLNKEFVGVYHELRTSKNLNLLDDHLWNNQLQYLFALSYMDNIPGMNPELRKIISYYLEQGQKYWMKRNPYLQAMIALVLHRNGDRETADLIIRSLKERATQNDEMGMYWKLNSGYYWYQAPIETQALLIEAFHEIAKDKPSVMEMKKYLLKQKQTQMWRTSKATVEAVYALLLDNENVWSESLPIQVKMGDEYLNPPRVEPGTGYYQMTWDEDEIKPEMGNLQLKNKNRQMAWGAMFWQYFEDLDKITAAESPLSIEKKLFKKVSQGSSTQLLAVNDSSLLKVGDKVVSRIVIRVDRDMDFVHLKDMRASGFEPRNVLSTYRYQNGLGYYESTKDAATHFYFSRLRKGTYVFETEMFATQKGEFSNGITTIQCMYAPEFSSHSEGIRVKVIN